MAFPDDALADASTWWSGHIGAALINQFIVAPLNAIRARIAGHGPIATGTVSVPNPGANQPGSATVTFPQGRFSGGVLVFTNPGTSNPGIARSSAAGGSTTGCTIYCTRTDSASGTQVAWLAVATS